MLKHIKDIRSPIAVAQQKQAARKASTESTSAKSPPLTGTSASSQGHSHHASHDRTRPPKLQVNSHVNGVAPGIMTGGPNAQSGWPEIMSPALEGKGGPEDQSQNSGSAALSSADGADGARTTREVTDTLQTDGISYAVAIYPYMAEQEDEFDVVV